MTEYAIQRFTRHCATTERELTPGEDFYSVLVEEGDGLVRKDYSADAWQGPPEQVLGWWKAQVPGPDAKKVHWAPNEVMLHFFEELGDGADRADVRYVLTLLLLRRRVFRMEREERDPDGREVLAVYCPRRETSYQIPVAVPDASRVQEIQDELARLLFAHAT
jgi:hypothetical protein